MRRLTSKPEKGAATVFAALLMVVMIGTVGLSVDVGALYAKKQELQNGTDAAAFAVAQEYADTGCVADDALARDYVAANVRTEAGSVMTEGVECGAESVRVIASGEQTLFFAQIIPGIDQSMKVGADSTVAWGAPASGPSILPIAISACAYYEAVGPDEEARIGDTINLVLPAPSHGETECSWHDDYPPAGFNWLDPTDGCGAYTEIGQWVGGDTGQDVPGPCAWADFNAMLGSTVLLPVFDDSRGSGSSGEYHISGYAALLLTGFHFNTLSSPKSGGASCDGAPTGQKACIIGEFQGYVGIDDNFEIGGPSDDGVVIVKMID